MLKRDEMTKEYVDGLLKEATTRIEFGGTLMGMVDDPEKGRMAIGRRDIFANDPKSFVVLGLLGPEVVSVASRKKMDGHMAEESLKNIEKDGLLDRVAAIVADSFVTFAFFSEGLIVGNSLGPVVDGYAEGKVLFNEKEYKLLAVDGNGVFGTMYNATAVDSNLNRIGIK